MEEPNNDIDTETLQAQIDLAMAQAQNLIASWLPASSGSLTQSSSRAAEAEAELQALLCRPPRLGVGAPLPESHAPAQVRLVQKLQGGKKRARKTTNGAHADVVGVKKNEEGEEEESSAEESRVGTIRKRTIIDPFDAVRKKGKKRRKEVEEMKEATDGAAQADDHMVIDEGTTDAFGTTAEPTPKKKKKKKRKSLLPEGTVTVELNGGPRSANTHNAQDEGRLTQPPLDTPEGKKPLRDGASEASDTDQRLVPAPGIGATSPTSPQSLSDFPIQQYPTLPFPPILNLTGPPSMAPEDTEGHPHKKRRRKRKKKKQAGDPL